MKMQIFGFSTKPQKSLFNLHPQQHFCSKTEHRYNIDLSWESRKMATKAKIDIKINSVVTSNVAMLMISGIRADEGYELYGLE